MNLYDVTFFIKSPRNFELPDSLILSDSFTVKKEEAEYRVRVNLAAENAQAALDAAREQAAALCQLLALRDSGWQIIEDARRKVTRLEPPYVSEGPPPPADVVGGMMTPEGIEFFDPDGERRRSGRVFNIFADGTLTHTDLSEEVDLLNTQGGWSESLRTALQLLHLGVLQTNPTINLVLSYTALETIADKKEVPLLHQVYDEEVSRAALIVDLGAFLSDRGFASDQVGRLVSSVENTRSQSQLDHFATYFAQRRIDMPIESLRKVRRLRGQLVHTGSLATNENKGLINQFCLAVRDGVRIDLGGNALFTWIALPPNEAS